MIILKQILGTLLVIVPFVMIVYNFILLVRSGNYKMSDPFSTRLRQLIEVISKPLLVMLGLGLLYIFADMLS